MYFSYFKPFKLAELICKVRLVLVYFILQLWGQKF
jgi:hypothetical protein